jgi:hypothetical protein
MILAEAEVNDESREDYEGNWRERENARERERATEGN